MERHARYTFVGVFVLGMFMAGAIFILWLAKPGSTLTDKYLISFTGNVTGLAEGSVVRHHGIKVGSVASVRFNPDTHVVDVMIRVARGTPVKADTVARLEVQGITGVPYIQLKGDTPGSPRLVPAKGKSYATIRSERSTLQSLMEDVPKVLKETVMLMKKVSALFSDENQGAIRKTLAHIEKLTGSLAGESDALRQTLDDMRAGARSFASMAGQVDALISENRRPLRDFTATGLYELTQFLTEARALVRSLSRLTTKLESDPARFLFGDTQKGVEVQ